MKVSLDYYFHYKKKNRMFQTTNQILYIYVIINMHHQQTNTEQAQVQTDNKTWANAITEPIATERTAQKGQNPNSKSALEAASPNSVLNVIVYGLTRIELCWNVTTMSSLYIYIQYITLYYI